MEVVQYLVQEGCSVLAVDDHGQTAVDAIKVQHGMFAWHSASL